MAQFVWLRIIIIRIIIVIRTSNNRHEDNYRAVLLKI